jgi:hypothetical protein
MALAIAMAISYGYGKYLNIKQINASQFVKNLIIAA